MAFSHLKVIRVMSRCNLNGSGTELFVHIRIGDDWNLPVHNRKKHHFANQIRISFILRMNGDSCITQHGLRTGGGNLNYLVGSNDWIIDMPEKSCLVLVFYFRIGNGCLADRTPVDNTGASINISFFIELDKDFFYCLGASLIQCETLSVPVCGRTELFQLADNPSAVLFSPLPGTFQKTFSSKLIFVDTFFF